MKVAKEIIDKMVHLINDDMASKTKVWCLLHKTPFEQTIKEARRWLTHLEVDDWGLGI